MSTPSACTRCGVAVENPSLHTKWHDEIDALHRQIADSVNLYIAHAENLIERVYVLERAVDGGPEDVFAEGEREQLAANVAAVEATNEQVKAENLLAQAVEAEHGA